MVFSPGEDDPQQVLTAAARPSAALWRLVAGVVVMSATSLALLWLGAGAFVTLAGEAGRSMLQAMTEGAGPIGLTALLLSFGLLTVGQAVTQGQTIADLGGWQENGGWAPHLHFQVIGDMLDQNGGNFFGVGHESLWDVWRDISPDPNLILRLPPGKFLA